ncbi:MULTISPECIES: hypothetical protein [unclassified Streptomyces]|uniref:hypothetical protein n=1 Tax=unclassified Streptomyces TaxID=2593676 RepID=UPI0034454394
MSTPNAPETNVEVAAQTDGLAVTGGNVADLWRGWVVWGAYNGWVNFPITWNVINPNSTVIVTASEVDANGVRFIGAAPVTVTGIAPGSGIVTVKINIAWNSPLRIRTDVVVLN